MAENRHSDDETKEQRGKPEQGQSDDNRRPQQECQRISEKGLKAGLRCRNEVAVAVDHQRNRNDAERIGDESQQAAENQPENKENGVVAVGHGLRDELLGIGAASTAESA